MKEEILLLGILLIVFAITFIVGIKVGKGIKLNKVLTNNGVSFESLYKEADELYEKAKQAQSERESLILACESKKCKEIANRFLTPVR